MVVVRMARYGAKKRPFYRMVVADSRFAKEGRCIETIGYYDPTTEPATVQFDVERLTHWKSKGARLTPTVNSLYKKHSTTNQKKSQKKPQEKP